PTPDHVTYPNYDRLHTIQNPVPSAAKTIFLQRHVYPFKLNEQTVVRGGTGLYYGDALGAYQSSATGNPQIAVISYANDGRADFAANPTNGQPLPTYAQAITRFCYANNNAPGCLIRDLQ